MPPLPADLQEIVTQLEEADRRGADLGATVTDEQFRWSPDGGRGWSIAQCLEHLAIINRLYGEAIRSGVERARARGWTEYRPITSTTFGRRFIASLEPPVTRRGRAPASVRPGTSGSRSGILQLYRSSHDLIRALVQESAGIDVNRATFANPFVRVIRVRVGTAFRIITAHDRRHLWQAERVRQAPGFPRG